MREALYAQHEVEARQQVERENQRAQPRQQVIACFTQSADLHQEAFAIDQTGDLWTAQHLSEAGHALSEAAQEAQAIQPRQQVIDLLTKLANFSQQAVAAKEAGNSDKAYYLDQACDALSNAARAVQSIQPRQQAIDLFTKSANLRQQAGAARDAGNSDKAYYLDQACHALCNAARAAQSIQPNQERINDFLRQSEESVNRANQASSCTIM